MECLPPSDPSYGQEDIASEAIIKTHEAIHSKAPDGTWKIKSDIHLKRYLLKRAKGIAKNYRKKHADRQALLDSVAPDSLFNYGTVDEEDDRLDLARILIQMLKPDGWETLLERLNGLSTAELADEHQIRGDLVLTHINRSTKQLRRLMTTARAKKLLAIYRGHLRAD